MAHGYLLHSFLSPLCNLREDVYGGSFEGRARFPLEVCEQVRAALPDSLPLLVRISATDWADGGWDLDQSVTFARELATRGVDLVDVSSGGAVAHGKVTAVGKALDPGYQVPFAARVRSEAKVPTAAVGLITDPHHAERIVEEGSADVVMLGRELLRSPHWANRAAEQLGEQPAWPRHYGWAVR
jgi:2,4-dienoyl-CoA reductase (NADPH2)